MIAGLFRKIQQHPPTDMVVAALVQKNAPKPIGEAIQGSGIPIKKGKVKNRGDISRRD